MGFCQAALSFGTSASTNTNYWGYWTRASCEVWQTLHHFCPSPHVFAINDGRGYKLERLTCAKLLKADPAAKTLVQAAINHYLRGTEGRVKEVASKFRYASRRSPLKRFARVHIKTTHSSVMRNHLFYVQ